MVGKKSWAEFRKTGLLLVINQILHVFGWAIVFQLDANGEVEEVYPARCKFRGFGDDHVTESYKQVTEYMAENIDDLKKEVNE